MVVHCVRCGKTEPLRKGRNSIGGGSLGTHKHMKDKVSKSYFNSCPNLCTNCLSDLIAFIESPEHQRQFKRHAAAARAS